MKNACWKKAKALNVVAPSSLIRRRSSEREEPNEAVATILAEIDALLDLPHAHVPPFELLNALVSTVFNSFNNFNALV